MTDRIRLSSDADVDEKELFKKYQAIAAERPETKYEPKNGGSSLAEFFKAMGNLANNPRPNGVLPLIEKTKAASE